MELIDALSNDKIIYQEQEDIIQGIGYKTKKERDICLLIADTIEATVAETIQSNKVASIPLIGSIWRDKTGDELYTHRKELRKLKKILPVGEYIEHISNLRKSIYMRLNKEQHDKYKAKCKVRTDLKFKFK